MRPIIVLTTGFGVVRDMQQRQLFQNYADAIYEAGGQPILALNCDSELADLAAGLFLTGGVDIEPQYYGMETAEWCGAIDCVRDQEEMALFRMFMDRRKPVLGVCRGLQLINTALGGTLWQDQKRECGVDGHENGAIHSVILEENSAVGKLFGRELLTNSYHHQSVRQLGNGLTVTGRSGKIVEAFEHTQFPVWAVQWHPERMTGKARITAQGPDMGPLFQMFVDACR